MGQGIKEFDCRRSEQVRLAKGSLTQLISQFRLLFASLQAPYRSGSEIVRSIVTQRNLWRNLWRNHELNPQLALWLAST
jgi:hypothetical protein